MPSNNCYIVKNQDDSYFKFNIDENNNLIAKNSSNNLTQIICNNILDFSVDMDTKNRIYLLYISLSGELKICIFPNTKNDSILTHIDMAENKIKYLNLVLLGEDIHIFYVMCNNDSPLYTIYHTYYHNHKWNLNKAAVIETDKYICPYTVVKQGKSIYLFHSFSNNKYCIKNFNYINKMWNIIESNIILEDALSTSLLINNKNIEIVCYNRLMNKSLCVFIKYKDLNNPLSVWSKEIMLSSQNINAIHPSIINKNNNTYILWEEGNKIVYRKSVSNIDTWQEKEVLTNNNSCDIGTLYFTNNEDSEYYKKTIVITNNEKYSLPLVSLDTFKKFIEISTPATRTNKSIYLEGEKINNLKNDSNSQVEMFNLALVNYSKNIEGIKNEIQNMKETVQSLQNKSYDSELIINQLKNTLTETEMGNNTELIAKLTEIIKLLQNENIRKDTKIKELEDKLAKKGFLSKLIRK